MQIVIDDEKIIDLLETEWGYEGIRKDVRRLLIKNGIPLSKALKQEPKTGHWISYYDEDAKEGWYECDRCHTERAFNTDYCPDCGAKMVKPQESEE